MKIPSLMAWTDGACSGNPGPGGWGSIIVFPEGRVKELGGFAPATTNNRMELIAVISALELVRTRPEELWILTDSTYVIRGITQWIWGWKKREWKNAKGEDVSNRDLWEQLDRLAGQRRSQGLKWHYVRGHQGTEGNERADQIAVSFVKHQPVNLYDGSLLQYPYAVYDIPEDTSLPTMKSTKEKKAAFSYLSYVNGELTRHKTWAECEARVKGRPGAKFKKAASPANEQEIVQGWGLDKSRLSKLD